MGEVSNMFQKEPILAAFDRYVEQFDKAVPGITSKQLHSHIVSQLCEKLAAKLGWNGHDVQLAWVMGLLHDIGRFEQARRYHTFIDYQSMDHARFGAIYLFEYGHIRDFVPASTDDEVLELSIRFHSAYEIPADVTGRSRIFCQLLRDADKIDLFRVYSGYLEHPETVWQVSLDDLGAQDLSPAVFREALEGRLVHTRKKRTALDFFVGCLCQIFDMTFMPSLEEVLAQGYYNQLLDFRAKKPESEKQLARIREKCKEKLAEQGLVPCALL